MDYKKIIKSREVRLAILRCLSFVPDKAMLQLQYRIKMNRRLNLKNPQRYTEKLQWYKLYYRNPEMIRCVDKYDVRSYVEEIGLGYILNECYGVYNTVEEIDFDKLPNQFVLKDTLGGGGNSVIIVRDKASMDIESVKVQMSRWVNEPSHIRSGGREWPYYSGKKHRIIVEKLLISKEDGDLPDHKFFCFNGKVFCSYLMQNYTMHHELGELGFLDRDYHLLSVCRTDFKPLSQQPEIPSKYEEMLHIAEKLSKKFPHVRVDLYNINGCITFGELTFWNASGYMKFEPDDFDIKLGENFILPEVTISKKRS